MTTTKHEDDALLVSRCLRGDATAWEALVQRYQRLVYAIVRRMGVDEHGAADVFQTVFSRLVQHLSRIHEPAHLQAWIVTTAKREALLQRERSLRTVSMTLADDDDGAATPEWEVADGAQLPDEALDELQQLNQLRESMEKLDQRCRELLAMLFSEDDKVAYDEVAAKLGMSVGSIGPTRARCLTKLRQLLP